MLHLVAAVGDQPEAADDDNRHEQVPKRRRASPVAPTPPTRRGARDGTTKRTPRHGAGSLLTPRWSPRSAGEQLLADGEAKARQEADCDDGHEHLFRSGKRLASETEGRDVVGREHPVGVLAGRKSLVVDDCRLRIEKNAPAGSAQPPAEV